MIVTLLNMDFCDICIVRFMYMYGICTAHKTIFFQTSGQYFEKQKTEISWFVETLHFMTEKNW